LQPHPVPPPENQNRSLVLPSYLSSFHWI